jgi:1,2-phenylacetyl-CoA epoxidase PaaB subunit
MTHVDRTTELARTGGRDTDSVWEVFARKAYEDPLHHVGTISEEDENLALVCARAVYDEHPWIQMIIVPRSAIREAISA